MRSIQRILGRAALVAVAGLAAVTLSAKSASATTLYSTNFTTGEGFTPGTNAANGQQGFNVTASGGATATITAGSGSGELTLTSPAGSVIVAAPTETVSSPSSFTVDVSTTLNIPSFSAGGVGPNFGIELVGNGGAVNIATLVVDGSTGEVYDSFADQTQLSGQNTGDLGTSVAAATNIPLEIDATFSGGQVSLNYLLNGVSVDTEVTNYAGTISSFYQGQLVGLEPYIAGTQDSGTADFTTYAVTTSVPEPSSLAALGFAGVLFLGRRSRKVAGL